MPGTLQVSVLELMDLPTSGQSSSTSSSTECIRSLFSLKIAMGKTEYQTEDKGDFSFPVTSLRENLKLTLHDADGNEIARTDVKTMAVVEKRFWDALFPLEGGGSVHLKLQFSLNAEEHKRICEMREAVLKKRLGELLKSTFKDSIAAILSIRSIHFSNSSIDERGKSLVASLSQELQQQPDNHHEQHPIHQSKANKEGLGTQVNQIDIHEIKASLEETLDPQLSFSGSLVSEEITATSSSLSAMAQEERKFSTEESVHAKFPVGNIKKMISAFETISVQEPRIRVGPTTESWMTRVKRGSSLRAPWLEETNTEKITTGNMMAKSFSTGTLSEMKSTPSGLIYEKVQQEERHSDRATSKKNRGNYNQFIESKNVQNHEKLDPGNKKSVSELLCATESLGSERTVNTIEIIETKEVVTFVKSADTCQNDDQHLSHETKEDPIIAFQLREHVGSFPEGVSFLDSETSYGDSDMSASDCFQTDMIGSEDHLLPKISKGEDKIYLGDYLETFDGRQLVYTNEGKKGDEDFMNNSMLSRKMWKMPADPAIREQLFGAPMQQGQPKPSIVKSESGLIGTRDDVYELTTCGSSDFKLDMLTYFDAEQCLLGSHGNSIPRHLCITSGSKRFKDIIGGFLSI